MEVNYAGVLHGPYDLKVEKWPMPEIDDNDVLIKVEAVGICGSDVKLYTTGKCGFDVITDPIVMGHEGAGVITQVGGKVKHISVGDRVAIEPTQPCRRCDMCKRGKYNLCVRPHYCSSLGAPGNLCRYYKHVADFCHKLPDNLTMEEGAAVQPLAIAIHACNRAEIKLGCSLVILGAGPIGLLCAMSARAMGASKILMTDVVQSRLDTARELAADQTLLVSKDQSDEETVEEIVRLLGVRPDVAIDACGFASAQRVALMVTKDAGMVLVVGIGAPKVEVPLSPALLREVDVRGSFRIMNTDVGMRNAAWEDIAEETQISVADCKETWNKLRNCYTNALKRRINKKSKKKSMPPWHLESQMSFLRPFLEIRTADDDDDESDHSDDSPPPRARKQTTSSNYKKVSAHLQEKRKKIDKKPEADAKPQKPVPSRSDMDETDLLFLSLSQTFKKLPRMEQCRLKFEIFKSVQEAELRQLEHQNIISPGDSGSLERCHKSEEVHHTSFPFGPG